MNIKNMLKKKDSKHIQEAEKDIHLGKEINNEKMHKKFAKKAHMHIKGLFYRKYMMKPEAQSNTRAGQMLRLLKENEYPTFRIYPTKGFISLPSKEDIKLRGMMYPLMKPYAYANIKFDPSENIMVYNVIEPELNEKERQILEKLKDGLMQIIDISLRDIRKEEKMIDFLEVHVNKLIEDYGFHLSGQAYIKLMYFIFRDFIGLNEIEPLLKDPYIEDIGADGVNVPLYIVHQKFGSIKTNIIFNDEKYLREFVTKLAERCDRYISYAEPLLDGSLPDGTRVQASLSSDVTTRGPTFSIRKFREMPFSPVDMLRLNTTSSEMLAYLWFTIEHGANILIAGGVATGKTTFLNCISLFISPDAKIVSIEDTRELTLPHENWIPGVARTGFVGTGTGEVSMFELLKESFRQNPDYLIVGEIRGKEAYVMFQSMASGHPSISTIHAGSVDDVIKRLQTKPINLSPGLLEALDIVIVMIHARERGKSSRRVKEIVEIESIDTESGRARISKAFVWLPSVDSFEYRGNSSVLNKISVEKGLPMNTIIKEISRRRRIINWLIENNISDMKEVSKYINMYYRNPEMIEKTIGIGEIIEQSADRNTGA